MCNPCSPLAAGHWQDLRLFYDAQSDLRVMFGYYDYSDDHAKGMTIRMHTAKVELQQEGDSWTVVVHDKVPLKYKEAKHQDKNWVPWNGTNTIT